MSKPLRAAVYVRISADSEGKGLGVKRQEQDCRTVCERRGWQVIEPLYSDNDKTAADPSKARPHYDRLIADMARGLVDVVVVAREDRLHRQPAELEQFVKSARSTGMILLSSAKSGDTDLSDNSAVMVLRIKGDVAAYEVDNLTDNVIRTKVQIAENGEYAGGRRPYGYRVVTKEQAKITGERAGLFVDEAEAVIVRECATRVVDGESLVSIVRDLNDRGIPTVRGKQWNTTTLRDLLLRPSITGLRVHQGEIIGEAAWEPILDRVVWQQVTDILTNPERLTPRASWDYPLKGVLKCSVCGHFMKAMPRKGHRAYGCCKVASGRVTGACGTIFAKADTLDEYVFSQILPIADDPKLRDAIRAAEQDSADETAELVREQAKDQAKLDQWDEDYSDGKASRASWLKQTGRLRERMEERAGTIAGMRGTSILDRLGYDVQERWPTLSADERKMILQAMVVEISVKPAVRGRTKFDPDRVDILWRYATVAKITVRGIRAANAA